MWQAEERDDDNDSDWRMGTISMSSAPPTRIHETKDSVCLEEV